MIGLDNLEIRNKTKINILLPWEIEIMIMVLTKTELLANRDDCENRISILKNSITTFI